MPEGPEVKLLVDNLHQYYECKHLSDIKILHGRFTKRKPNGLDDFLSSFQSKDENSKIKLTMIDRIGKRIIFQFANDWYLFNSLGMGGWWYRESEVPKKLRNHIVFEFAEAGCENLVYTDTRNFGTFHFTNDKKLTKKKLAELAVDVYSPHFTYGKFKANYDGLTKTQQTKTIAEIIMNQKLLVAGVGNYLKAEILYDCKISPHRKMSEIKEKELKMLYKKTVELANASLKSQGLVNRYSLAEKDEQFVLKVYMQKKDPHGNPVIREETKDKRTTHWVKEIQK